MKKKICNIIIFSLICISALILLIIFAKNIVFAYSKVPESDVYYVNATLTKINGNEYNAKMRGMTSEQYWNYSYEQRQNIDENYMLFGGTGVPGVSALCSYNPPNQNAGKLFQGLANEYLSNNNLWIWRFNNGESFFPTESYASQNSNLYGEILRNWKFPFKKEADGYYVFDSDQYMVQRNYSSNKFELYADTNHYQFYPFNNLGDNTSDVNVRKYYYTMRLDIPYIMTEDGKINGRDMIFNFSGDDDVWIYIDGRLAIDLGGAHPKATGNINFASNSVYYANNANFSARTDYNVLNSSQLEEGRHTLSIFYMDRGDGEANFSARFNIQPGSVKTNYVDKATNKVLQSTTKVGGYGEQVTTSSRNISGYTLVENPSTQTYSINSGVQTVTYYYQKNSKVKVHYVDKKNNNELANTTEIEGYNTKSYSTSAKSISGYKLNSTSNNTAGKMTADTIDVYYYYDKLYNVTTHYIDKIDNKEIAEQVIYSNKQGTNYTTSSKNISNYTLIGNSGNIQGIIGENNINVYYYYKYNSTGNALHIDKNTGQELAKDTFNGLEGDKINTRAKDINNYTLVEKPNPEQITLSKSTKNVIYYYAKNTKVIENFYDKYTGEKITNSTEINGYVGKDYESKQRFIEGYTFSNVIGTTKGKMTEKVIEVNYYYFKNSDVIVHYIDKVDNKEIADKVIIKGYQEKNYETNSKNITNYTLVGNSGNISGKFMRNDIDVYYYYLYNSKAEVHYEDKYTGELLKETEKYRGLETEKVSTFSKEVEGYTLVEKPNPEQIIFNKENQVKKYLYAKNTNVIMKFVDIFTNKELEERQEIKGYQGKDYGTNPAIVEQYELVGDSNNTRGKMSRDTTYVTYYYKYIGEISVRHIDFYSKEILQEDRIKGLEGNKVKTEAKDIEGYTLIQEPVTNEYTITKTPQTVVYYYAKNSNVIVNYINSLDDSKLVDNVIIKGYQGKEYETQEKTFEGFELVGRTSNIKGIMDNKDILVYYYYLQDSGLTTNYVDKYSNERLDIKVQEGREGDRIKLEKKQFEGYTLIEEPEEDEIILTKEHQTCTYYYAKNSKLKVKYIDKITNKEITDSIEIEGYEGKDYETEEKKFNNYTLVEKPIDYKGKMKNVDMEIIYYYKLNSNLIVNYIDKNTEELLSKEELKGLEQDKVQVQAKDIEGYVLVEEPENKEIILTKETQVVNFYYAHVSKGVIVKHIDEFNNRLLEKEIVIEGKAGDKYETVAKEFKGYKLNKTKLPKNANGILSNDLIEVYYYYNFYSQVTVNYVEKYTNKKLDKDVITGKEGDKEKILEKVIKGYTLIQRPTQEEIIFTKENQELTYYYAKNTNVKVHYIDKISNKEIVNSIEIKGYEGKEYETQEKNIEGYKLVEKPINRKGKMTADTIDVYYYYIKNSGLIVRYIDKNTGKELLDSKEIKGSQGDIVEISSRKIEGYTLIEKPKEEKIVLKNNLVTVDYLYSKNIKITTKYVDIKNMKEIAEKELIDILVGNNYETTKKDIEKYKLVQTSGNAKGIALDNIEVIYYYAKEGNIDVEHIDQFTNKIIDVEEINGYVGDKVKTSAKEFEGYKLIKVPENQELKISYEAQVQKYYYRKILNVVVKHIDITTGKELSKEILQGLEGEKKITSPKEIEGYTLIERPSIEQIILEKENSSVTYYYTKNTKVIVHYVDNKGNTLKEVTLNGYINKEYETEKIDFEGYNLISTSENTKGKMEENTIDVYYNYEKITIKTLPRTGNNISHISKIVRSSMLVLLCFSIIHLNKIFLDRFQKHFKNISL